MRIPLFIFNVGSAHERINQTSDQFSFSTHQFRTSQTLLNVYPRPSPTGFMFVPTPGMTVQKTAVGADTVRLLKSHPDNNKLYVVAGNDLSVWSAGSETDIGDLNTSAGAVRAAINSQTAEMIVVDGTNGYIVDTSAGTIATITDADYPDTANICAFIDGYFLVANSNDASNAGRFYWSNLNDGTAWTATDFATKEGGGDDIRDIVVKDRLIYLIGQRTTEIWYNSGDPDQVFKRTEGGIVPYGTLAPHMASIAGNKVCFPAHTEQGAGLAVALHGPEVEIISDPAISNILEETYFLTTDPRYAFGYGFLEQGHEFYAMAQLRDNDSSHPTLLYDFVTKQWHMRAHYDATDFPSAEIFTAAAWDVHGTTSAFPGHMLFGHRTSGELYAASTQTSDIDNAGTGNNTDSVPRRMIGPQIRSNKLLRFREVVLEMGNSAGVGTVPAADVDLYISKDGGNSWGSAITMRLDTSYDPGGGVYRANNLGAGRNWRFRLDIDASAANWAIRGFWGITAGDEDPEVAYT